MTPQDQAYQRSVNQTRNALVWITQVLFPRLSRPARHLLRYELNKLIWHSPLTLAGFCRVGVSDNDREACGMSEAGYHRALQELVDQAVLVPRGTLWYEPRTVGRVLQWLAWIHRGGYCTDITRMTVLQTPETRKYELSLYYHWQNPGKPDSETIEDSVSFILTHTYSQKEGNSEP